jgi:Fur family ferric uptake transcriptional regulator
MSCRQRLIEELRSHGFRVTPQRAIILETIAHGEGRQSAHEVHAAAQRELPGLHLATVYRTVDALNRVGIVDVFSTHAQSVEFSLRDVDHPHDHLVCRNCDEIIEIPCDYSEQLIEEIHEAYGFDVDVGRVVMTGLCPQCANTAIVRKG